MSDEINLDRASILERLGGDAELFAELVSMYVQEAEGYATALGEALAANDPGVVQREAHTIKGLLATFSDETGSEMAYAIEVQAKSGALDDMPAAVAAVQARVRRLAELLRSEG
ncbi:MAG TPA: Hpt domain-containing protein [Rhodocyclaceae bacterium]|nr:Hpt domain-containing protein [Rhodocyclaceae bacterium]